VLKFAAETTEKTDMDTSAISGSSNGASLPGQIDISLLKKSQDLQSNEVAKLLQSAQVSPPNLGNKVDVIA
jgi:hypothetical protein